MTDPRILILGAGKYQRTEGAFHVDRIKFEGIDLQFDLDMPIWNAPMHPQLKATYGFDPFADNTWEQISAVHLVEHLKSLINFMDEAHRILKPGGTLYIETPVAGGDYDLTHSDPTHIRCYRKHTFINYFTLQGIAAFGYTDKPCAILHLEEKNNNLIFHGTPIKSII